MIKCEIKCEFLEKRICCVECLHSKCCDSKCPLSSGEAQDNECGSVIDFVDRECDL